MSMEISKSFVVMAPASAAWAFLTDPHRVASCLPGAAVTGQLDERTYAGTITVKVGPVSASYRGTMRFERLDAAAWTAELSASGQDVRGKGGADMRMTSRLVERAPAETEIAVVSQVNVMGVLAQFGRGMIQDVSDQMFQKFADAMRAQLESAPTRAMATGAGEVANEAPAAGVLPEPLPGGEPTRPVPGTPPPGQPPAVPPVELISLGSGVIGRAAARTARQPVAWVVVLVLLAVLLWFWRA